MSGAKHTRRWGEKNRHGMALMEAVAHAAIDYAKCAGRISFGEDQVLHIACKVVWLGLWMMAQ